ncbi:MAG: MBL fold metallo-hydrolase [Ruminococcus sp.]|nr:MBL fold metallo-hydrolase [Ruminococcus sp.]
MKIHTLQLGELRANCYLAETAPGRCVAVDIGGQGRLLLEYMTMKGLHLSKILLTHGHYDHFGGVEEVRRATGAEVYIHAADAVMLESEVYSLHDSISIMPFAPVTDYTAVYGDCYINDGDCEFRVIHTPGHSKGSVCYTCGDVMFSGDTLFCCSVGRTDLPGSNPLDMVNSLRKLYKLDGDHKVYPGHNDRTELSYERQANPYMKRFRG